MKSTAPAVPAFLALLLLAGVAPVTSACSSRPGELDPHNDVVDDLYEVHDVDVSDDSVAADTHVADTALPDTSVPAGGLLLRGVVLTPDGPLQPGEVLVEGALITCVAADCSAQPGAVKATVIDTGGTISPGLVDAHNHMAYNFLPEWEPGRTFNNRYEWADDPDYERHILPYTAHRSSNSHFCPGAKWAELRSVIHGTTTIQGQPSAAGSCINGMVRNANLYHGLGYDHMRGTIGSPRDLTDADAQGYVTSFTSGAEPTTRFHVHMCEGLTGSNLELEFASFAGRDTRTNRHQGTSLLSYGTAVLIHAMILTPTELDEVATTGSMVVWSPSSNLALYDRTAPIADILARGIKTAIGPDWTVSGADEMLSELRVALDYGQSEGIAALTPRKLWEMATADGATVVGLETHVGALRVGYRADIAVFGRTAADPYRAVIDSRARDVQLVLIDGKGYFGDAALQGTTARNDRCEVIDVCGAAKYLCVRDTSSTDWGTESMAELEQQLYDILEGIGYPADEQYGRGSELQALVDCAL